MLKIGDVVLGKQPRIVLTVGDIKSILLKMSLFKKADILELRIDCFKNIEEENIIRSISAIKKMGLPVIATIRSKKEGGDRYISSSCRLQIFKAVMPFVDAVDVEISSSILDDVIRDAKAKKKRIILSYHNFKQTPLENRLERIIKKGKASGGGIIKIASFAKSKGDILRLLNFTFKHREKNIVTISLGKKGMISRVLFPFFGSLFTYAYLDKPFAPGQMDIKELKTQVSKIKMII